MAAGETVELRSFLSVEVAPKDRSSITTTYATVSRARQLHTQRSELVTQYAKVSKISGDVE